MESVIFFIYAYVAAIGVFWFIVLFFCRFTKALYDIRREALPIAIKREQGKVGLLLSLSAFFSLSPFAYVIARGIGSAEAIIIIHILLFVPLLWISRRAIWNSLYLMFGNLFEGGTPMEQTNTCPVPDANPTNEEIVEILKTAKTIAIVGLSDNPEKDSNRVARYLLENNYNVIPVNPSKKEILGKTSYPDLASIPEKIDIVDIFRQVEAIPQIVDEAIKVGAKVVWMQLGLAHPEAAKKARDAGLKVIQSKCIKIEHSKIFKKEEGISFNILT